MDDLPLDRLGFPMKQFDNSPSMGHGHAANRHVGFGAAPFMEQPLMADATGPSQQPKAGMYLLRALLGMR